MYLPTDNLFSSFVEKLHFVWKFIIAVTIKDTIRNYTNKSNCNTTLHFHKSIKIIRNSNIPSKVGGKFSFKHNELFEFKMYATNKRNTPFEVPVVCLVIQQRVL